MYETCFFDYGNTLVEFDRRQITWIVRRLSEELGRRFGPIDEEELQRAMDRLYALPRTGPAPTYREVSPLEEMEMLLNDLYGRDSRTRESVEEADAAYQAIFLEAVTIAPSDRELLSRLAARLPLALVSNYPCEKTIKKSLSRVGIDGFFKTVVVSGEVGFVKPHPRIFEEALARMGADPARALFVGDRWDADLCGARDAGLRTCHMIGFTSETGFEECYRIYRPDHLARSLEEVAGILGL